MPRSLSAVPLTCYSLMMDRYAQIWERFVRERRLEFGGYMDPAWQDGHALSACLIIPVSAPEIRERLEPLRTALRPFPFVSLHPDHFMHITLFLLGFVVEKPERDNEVSPQRLREIEADARRVLASFPAFSVHLANLNAFPGAAFVEAHDARMLDRLRDALRAGCGLEQQTGPPHMTLAYFHAPDGILPEELISAMERYRNWPVGELAVESVALTLLDLRREYPEPETLAKMPLKAANAEPLA